MDETQKNIAAYDKMQPDLEAEHMGKWIVIHSGKLNSIHDKFETAAEEAVGKFGAGPYLIRQVGAPPITLPASVMYRE